MSIYTALLQLHAAKRNLMWNKIWQFTLLGKKENNSAEFKIYASILSLSFKKQENGKIKSRSLCTMHNDTSLQSKGFEKQIAIEEPVL